jgi:hypothetical protein
MSQAIAVAVSHWDKNAGNVASSYILHLNGVVCNLGEVSFDMYLLARKMPWDTVTSCSNGGMNRHSNVEFGKVNSDPA